MRIEHSTKWLSPNYHRYCELLDIMRVRSERFKMLDSQLYAPFTLEGMKRYENSKIKAIHNMFGLILEYFPQLKMMPCAVYLNGSYARMSITACSDLDIIFLFDDDFIHLLQTPILQIRLAMARMLDIDVVHIHSFAKNFVKERIKNRKLNTVDYACDSYFSWPFEKEVRNIEYPKVNNIAEREICEYLAVKSWDDFCEMMRYKIEHGCEEWMYSFSRLFLSTECYDMEKFILDCESILLQTDNYIHATRKALSSLAGETHGLLKQMDASATTSRIQLSEYKTVYKKQAIGIVSKAFAVYHRIDRLSGGNLGFLNLPNYFEHICINESMQDVFRRLEYFFYYHRYVMSKMEILLKEKCYHFSHRSNEWLAKQDFAELYKKKWECERNCFDEVDSAIWNIVREIKIVIKDFYSTIGGRC